MNGSDPSFEAAELDRAARELILCARSAGWAGADRFDALWYGRWPDALTRGRRGVRR